MYLGDIKNLSQDTSLSSDTIKTLSEFSFIERFFESKFKFDSIKIKDHEIMSSLNDLHYIEKIGFYRVKESHLFNSFIRSSSIDLVKPVYQFNDEIQELKNHFKTPDIVFNRLKDNFIEELSFYKSDIEDCPILKIATKARYYKSGKFFRDNSNTGFIFSKYNYLFSRNRPFASFKFNKNNVTFNYYTNSKNKHDKKRSFSFPLMDCLTKTTKINNKNDYIFSVFGKEIKLDKLIENFDNLKNVKINSKTDLFSILSDSEIELLNIITF